MAQVGDYNIANASGASVRSDLNAVFAAIKTLNSGGSDPSNTSAFMPYVDTADSNNLKIRNAANDGFVTVGSVDSANLGLLPRAGGTMTGQLLADDSAGASAPAIAFDGDTDTGIFRVGANTMGFATAGVERVEISDAGLDMSNGLPIRFQDSSGAPFVALKSPSSVSSNVTFTLPGADGSAGEFLKTDGSGNLSFSIVQGVPSGSVFCMAVATVPSGYLECNGAAVSRTTYSVLFAVIGTAYGTGNGSSTFNLPDLRGEFVRGFDNGKGTDSGRSIATSQGSQNAQHNHSASATSTAGAHSHSLNYQRKHVEDTGTAAITDIRREGGDGDGGSQTFTNDTTSGFMNNATVSVSTSVSIGNQGGNESRPRNVAMMYVIKI
jgi:microcystin-dependent protein|tara:strand:- start:119 stop:1258 length:1140 start_codon:yes stop_codon:yes gene_type:complete